MGVSFDPPSENQAWALEEGFQFELWTDADRELALHYGAATSPTQGLASRITKVMDASGTLVLEYRVTAVGTHPEEVLEDCRILFGQGG